MSRDRGFPLPQRSTRDDRLNWSIHDIGVWEAGKRNYSFWTSVMPATKAGCALIQRLSVLTRPQERRTTLHGRPVFQLRIVVSSAEANPEKLHHCYLACKPACTTRPTASIWASVISGYNGSEITSDAAFSDSGMAPGPYPRSEYAVCKCTGTG